MSFLTRWFSNSFQGIPQITNAAGTLVAALDAMLVNGFNEQTATSLTQTAGVATLVFSGSGHGFVQHSVIRISGASPAGWNGDYRVTGVSGANVTFVCDDTLSAASGTISVKFAPADFEIVYTGTNKRVYRSTAIDSTRCLLHVNDTTGALAQCSLYEDMTNVDTGTLALSLYTYKRGEAGNAPYELYADDRLFYLFTSPWGATEWGGVLVFGDILSFKSGDAYHCVLAGQVGQNAYYDWDRHMNPGSFYIARSQSGLPGYRQCALTSVCQRNATGVKFGDSELTFPNPSSNGVHPCPVYVTSGTDLRGQLPGMYLPIGNIYGTVHGTLYDVPGMGVMRRQAMYSSSRCLMSLGDWRV